MNEKNIAIIPARGGSKRIPRKNVKNFLGKPIIAYSIEAALNTKIFDEVMVSTDDNEIAGIAIKYGASVPFFRNTKTANDHANITDVLEEVLEEYKKINQEFKYGCCILATAPFVSEKNLIESFNLLKSLEFISVFPVVKFSYPIQRALKIKNNKVAMIWPENYFKRSQDLESGFHDAGQFYWFEVKEFLKEQKIFTENSGVIELSELEAQDIDTLEDWKIAELKYKLLENNFQNLIE